MGVCASSPRTKQSRVGGGGEEGGNSNNMKRVSTAKVIHMDGRLQELNIPIRTKSIVSQNPRHFLCSSESMTIGTCMPQMADEEELQMGHIYFLLPISQAHKKVTLKDLCSLAVKANNSVRYS
ncbi:HTH-type transcriptional regulator [Melia azedarach]|uniref:HTH-type transcriptional regulator n=1 Tax=Melia azedarach TaxID=155640 RepID=A0ACC1XU94_MELAZ|nr:HTH-type transcriptional regulator [Melia azedarach]